MYTSLAEEEDEEDRDKFLNIVLSDPHKVGDGMSSYMVYKITTTVLYIIIIHSTSLQYSLSFLTSGIKQYLTHTK